MGWEEEGEETSVEGGGTVGRCTMSVLNFFVGRDHLRESKRVVGTEQAGSQGRERVGNVRRSGSGQVFEKERKNEKNRSKKGERKKKTSGGGCEREKR